MKKGNKLESFKGRGGGKGEPAVPPSKIDKIKIQKRKREGFGEP